MQITLIEINIFPIKLMVDSYVLQITKSEKKTIILLLITCFE